MPSSTLQRQVCVVPITGEGCRALQNKQTRHELVMIGLSEFVRVGSPNARGRHIRRIAVEMSAWSVITIDRLSPVELFDLDVFKPGPDFWESSDPPFPLS